MLIKSSGAVQGKEEEKGNRADEVYGGKLSLMEAFCGVGPSGAR